MFTIEIYILGELLPTVFSLNEHDYQDAIWQMEEFNSAALVIGDYRFNRNHITKIKVGGNVDIL